MNISQEGRDDIDDLREAGWINGLKISTKGYQAVTAFQLSQRGTYVKVTSLSNLRINYC